jgi:hypothetical protein
VKLLQQSQQSPPAKTLRKFSSEFLPKGLSLRPKIQNQVHMASVVIERLVNVSAGVLWISRSHAFQIEERSYSKHSFLRLQLEEFWHLRSLAQSLQ